MSREREAEKCRATAFTRRGCPPDAMATCDTYHGDTPQTGCIQGSGGRERMVAEEEDGGGGRRDDSGDGGGRGRMVKEEGCMVGEV